MHTIPSSAPPSLPRHAGGAYSDLCTSDCAPTLADAEVLEFCKAGFLKLDGVVPAGADVLQSLIERYSHVQCPRDCSSAKCLRLLSSL
jgi:hypothetical protein